MKTITIIDYDMGNIGSIANMFKKVGCKTVVASDIETIKRAEKIVLPGVGAFDSGMTKLIEADFIPVLNKKILEEKVPVLGICLGMHLMTKSSEEGRIAGLGWVDAETIKFNFSKISEQRLKIPHMGWNLIKIQKDSLLFDENNKEERRYYFVHSFHVVCNNSEDVLANTYYGYDFVSMFEKENVIGAQFHPEKSHIFGKEIFRRFAENY